MFDRTNIGNPGQDTGASDLTKQPQTSSRFGRRSFLRRVGLGGAALLPAGSILANGARAGFNGFARGGLTRGDAAILRLLAAAEILETDLWQQYNELALGNEAFQNA